MKKTVYEKVVININDVSGLVKKTDYHAKIKDIDWGQNI